MTDTSWKNRGWQPVVLVALLLGSILNAQLTFHGLTLFSPISVVRETVTRLRQDKGSSNPLSYIAIFDGEELSLTFTQFSSREPVLSSIRSSSYGTYADYLARVTAYQAFFKRTPSRSSVPNAVLPIYGSTWNFFPEYYSIFFIGYNPQKGILVEQLQIDLMALARYGGQ